MQLLEDLAKDPDLLDPLAIRMMPRDVVTRWNSMYDMLVFALEYRKAIDEISGDKEMRKYELEEEEWDLVQQLCDILKVCCFPSHISVTHIFSALQGRNLVLFTCNTKPSNHNPCNGPHRRSSCHSKSEHEVLTCHPCVAGTWKSAPKQILQYDRPFRGLPHRDE